jgi:hypothetical protein
MMSCSFLFENLVSFLKRFVVDPMVLSTGTSLIPPLSFLQLVTAQILLASFSGLSLQLFLVDGFRLDFPPILMRPESYVEYQHKFSLHTSRLDNPIDSDISESESYTLISRRNLMLHVRLLSLGAASLLIKSRPSVASEVSSLDAIRAEIQKARKQMDSIPELIQSEQWDSVRAILITPPLSDLWTKSSRKMPLLVEYATAIGETPSGDELAVLEAKEDVSGHLRFLDMAVYNNNFNPIKSMGETGATKELIRSYYDDPTNEYKASVAALDELIQLGNVQ